jgi:hypothetical protein
VPATSGYSCHCKRRDDKMSEEVHLEVDYRLTNGK